MSEPDPAEVDASVRRLLSDFGSGKTWDEVGRDLLRAGGLVPDRAIAAFDGVIALFEHEDAAGVVDFQLAMATFILLTAQHQLELEWKGLPAVVREIASTQRWDHDLLRGVEIADVAMRTYDRFDCFAILAHAFLQFWLRQAAIAKVRAAEPAPDPPEGDGNG